MTFLVGLNHKQISGLLHFLPPLFMLLLQKNISVDLWVSSFSCLKGPHQSVRNISLVFRLLSQRILNKTKTKLNHELTTKSFSWKTPGVICPKQKFCLDGASAASRRAHSVVRKRLLSHTGCTEEKLAALSRSYRLYYSYNSHTDWTLQHGLTAWAWNWKTKVKYRLLPSSHDHFQK